MDIERLVEKWLRLTLAEQRYIEGIVDRWLAVAVTAQRNTLPECALSVSTRRSARVEVTALVAARIVPVSCRRSMSFGE